jgi:hypothetical protein
VLVRTLKRGDAASSHLLGNQIASALAEHGVQSDVVRVMNHNVRSASPPTNTPPTSRGRCTTSRTRRPRAAANHQ